MSPAGRYRHIRSRLWLDPPFVGLSEGEKLVALYLLSGPPTNSIGLYRLSPGTAADELHLTPQRWWKRFRVVLRAFQWRYDEAVRVVWIPEWVQDNPPPNPNVVRSWRVAFDEIPECLLKTEALAAIRALLNTKPEPFRKPFNEPFAKPFGNGLANPHVPVPEGEMVPETVPVPDTVHRAARQRANAAQTRETVQRLRVLAEHSEMRERSGS